MDLNGLLAKMRKSSNGQTLTEYSMVVLFVGVAAYSAYAGLGLGIKALCGESCNFFCHSGGLSLGAALAGKTSSV